MRQLLSDGASMRVSQNCTSLEPGFREDPVQVGCETRNIVWSCELPALPMATKVGNKQTKSVLKQRDQRIEHVAGRHEPVQQQEGFTFANEFEEYAVRRTVLAE